MGQLSKSTLRGKKQFLKAGLYSGATNSNNNNPTNKLENEFKFELPIHHGQWILETETDFDLPLDIMEDYEHDRLFLTGNSSTNKPPRYTRLQHSKYCLIMYLLKKKHEWFIYLYLFFLKRCIH